MTFGTQLTKIMLSLRNTEAGVCNHFPKWPPPPAKKSLKCQFSVNYGSKLIKFGAQTKKKTLTSNNTKAENWQPVSKTAVTAISESIQLVLIITFLSSYCDENRYTTQKNMLSLQNVKTTDCGISLRQLPLPSRKSLN
jgi:hypothetical protein